MPTSTDVRKYGETVLEQGKAALGEARKPLLAAVGATNLAIGQLRSQLKDLPAETQEQLKKLQDRANTLDRTRVRKAVEEYAEQARETYATLAQRGERVVRQLRRDPRVRNAFAETEELVERTETAVTGRPATNSTTRSSSGTAPARKSPARKATPKS
jgi:predicted DNA-binding protein